MSRADKRIHRERVVGTERDETVRLYAFANTRPGYQVCFAPERPVIILKSKRPAAPQHPCAQWKPFADLLFRGFPNTTHAVYVADTTPLTCKQGLEREEEVNGAAVGTALKQLRNTIAKLNPHNAVMVAAGPSALLAMKYMMVGEKAFGHRDRLVERLVLVDPKPLPELERLTAAVRRMHGARDGSYPKFSLVTLLPGGGSAQAFQQTSAPYQRWLKDSADFLSSTTLAAYAAPTIFLTVARHAVGDEHADFAPQPVDEACRLEEPMVYRIDFVLSRDSKMVEQLPRPSPLETLGVDEYAPDAHAHDHSHHPPQRSHDEHADPHDSSAAHEGVGAEEAASASASSCAEAHAHGGACGCEHGDHDGCADCVDGDVDEDDAGNFYVEGITALSQWRDPVRVMLEGRVLDLSAGLVGTTEGCVTVEGLAALAQADDDVWKCLSADTKPAHKKKSAAAAPPAVALATRLARDEQGRTSLRALEVRLLSRTEEKHSLTAGSGLDELALGFHASAIAHSCGAVLVRGRKCALVRSGPADNKEDGAGSDNCLRLPQQPHADAGETAMECALRALCDACDVSSDNFYVPSYLPPVVYYPETAPGEASTGPRRCVTLFIAFAVCPPPGGPASDAKEDVLDPTEPYDWVSFDKALSLLGSQAERDALAEVRTHVRRAAQAGFFSTFAGCGVFGDAVAAPASPPARKPVAASKANKTTVELVVVLCPGCRALPDAVRALVPRMLHDSGRTANNIFTYDGDSSTEDIESAVREAAAGSTGAALTLAVFLNQEEVDVGSFCEEQLYYLLQERGIRTRLFTVLTPAVTASFEDLAGDTEERAALLGCLLDDARASDVMCAVTPTATLRVTTGALLLSCAAVCPELTLLHVVATDGCSSDRLAPPSVRQLSLAEVEAVLQTERESSGASPGGCPLYTTFDFCESERPVAPAALNFVQSAHSLERLYAAGEVFLTMLDGNLWVATRPGQPGLLSLNSSAHCGVVEGGERLEAKGHTDKTSTLRVGVLCASAAAAEKAKTTAASLFAQLLWSAERDGQDWTRLQDPLPPWE